MMFTFFWFASTALVLSMIPLGYDPAQAMYALGGLHLLLGLALTSGVSGVRGRWGPFFVAAAMTPAVAYLAYLCFEEQVIRPG